MIRTDLAAESDVFLKTPPKGITQDIKTEDGVKITEIEIKDEQASKAIGRPIGKYITFETDNMLSFEQMDKEEVLLSEELKKMLPQKGFILVVGLGNEEITPDAVGPKVASSIMATRHFHSQETTDQFFKNLRQVSIIHPGVLGQTGIESSEIALSLCKQLNPVALIAIDALAARSIDRLGTTIQISNSGISPGSGVSNSRKELSYNTLGIPVISIGIPTVVDMQTIAQDYCEGNIKGRSENMMVTPRNIDRLIEKSSKLLAIGINLALFPTLSLDDINSLISQ